MDNPNQSPQAQEVHSQMPPINNSSKSKVIPIILGIAAAIVIAIGAYVLGTKQSQPVVQAPVQTTPSPSKASAKVGVDETANWKTYTDTTFPISLQYPPTWVMEPLQYEVSIPTFRIRKISTAKDEYPTEILVGDWGVYSTSGTLCANMGCDYNFGKIEAVINNEKLTADIVKAFNATSKEVGYYAAQITLSKKFAVKLPPLYPESVAPNVTIRYHSDEEKQEILKILSTLKFINEDITQVNGVSLENIKYMLPKGWTAEITKDGLGEENLSIKPNGGGYFSIKVHNYTGTIGRKEYYCQVKKVCIEGTSKFTEVNIGNISGYIASALDNSGGGSEYFGSKGNKFYIISSYSPPSPNEFEKNYQKVLDSLIF